MKEIEDDTHRWKDIPCSWIGRINIVKMTVLPKAIYIFNAIPIKLPMAFFHTTTTKYFNICMDTQKIPNRQSNLGKEKRSWRNQEESSIVSLQTILQCYSHQNSMYWHKNRTIDQWNRIESPEINPCTDGQLIYDKGGKAIQWRKDSLFNKWYLENWTATCKRMKLEQS